MELAAALLLKAAVISALVLLILPAIAGVPCRLIKQVSDDAGEGAARTWQESVDDCARVLAGWVAVNLR